MTEWVIGNVKQVIRWTQNLFSLIIHAPIDPFIAGQFTKLGLEINGEKIYRAYSYVNAPRDSNLEFYLVTMPDGKLSALLYQLKPMDRLIVSKRSSGFLILDEIPLCEDLWMLATGTAIGPYLSILQQGEGLDRFQRIILVHAVRFFKDLSYLPKMLNLKNRYNDKLFIQTITSREKTSESLNGRIPALIANGTLERQTNIKIDSRKSHIMLCGNPEMVRDTYEILENKYGMRKHLKKKPGHITSENYW